MGVPKYPDCRNCKKRMISLGETQCEPVMTIFLCPDKWGCGGRSEYDSEGILRDFSISPMQDHYRDKEITDMEAMQAGLRIIEPEE